jgi:hypothetical protein
LADIGLVDHQRVLDAVDAAADQPVTGTPDDGSVGIDDRIRGSLDTVPARDPKRDHATGLPVDRPDVALVRRIDMQLSIDGRLVRAAFSGQDAAGVDAASGDGQDGHDKPDPRSPAAHGSHDRPSMRRAASLQPRWNVGARAG